jgi:hypothetical protein
MRYAVFVVLVAALCGCSTPNPNPAATAAAYDQVKVGMTRQQVYALLGPPKSVRPAGDMEHCQTATWGIPHGTHGWGHWKVKFTGDSVSDVSMGPIQATASASVSH